MFQLKGVERTDEPMKEPAYTDLAELQGIGVWIGRDEPLKVTGGSIEMVLKSLRSMLQGLLRHGIRLNSHFRNQRPPFQDERHMICLVSSSAQHAEVLRGPPCSTPPPSTDARPERLSVKA